MIEKKEEALPKCPDGLSLEYRKEGLTLTGDGMELLGDFLSMLPRLKKSNLEREMLLKAAKLKGEGPFKVIDATAGMGEDSLILAAGGYRVEMYEKDPIIAALLRDCLERAKKDPQLQQIAERMQLLEEDSIEAMKKSDGADIVLLDPMFPSRSKSALIKKKFQLLQKLERPCGNEEELLEAASALHPRKIVIKRPVKGPYLAGRKPDYSLSGKAIRYDCIVFAPTEKK